MESKAEQEADATKELVQKITQKIFSNSSVDRDEVRSIISKVLRDYKVEFKKEINE